MNPPIIFSGSSHPILSNEAAALLGTSLGKIDLHLFPDNEIFVEILEDVQGKSVFVIQSLGLDPNFHLMELLIILDALKRASVGSTTVILPYYSYGRQDRLDQPGVPITAKLIANLLTCSGAAGVVAMDLHSDQIEGFFDIPFQHLHSRPLFLSFLSSLDLKEIVVVAPDKGGIKIAEAFSKDLSAPLAFIEKERLDPFTVEMRLFVGDVKDKTVLIVDDICSTGGTLINAAKVCLDRGAKRIIAIVGHGLFIGNALDNLENSPIEQVILTNSIPMSDKVLSHSKIKIVSIAPLLAEAIGKKI